MNNIKKKVDEYVNLKRKITKLQEEAAKLEADLIIHGEELLADTKYKSVRMTGENMTCAVTATTAETLKVIYPSLLKEVFGKVYTDCVKEETTYTVNAHGKRILLSLLTGAYSEGTSLEKLINGLDVDDKTGKTLFKKLKGISFDTDKKTLMKLTGMDEETASDYAYMAMEAAAWQNIYNLLFINGYNRHDLPIIKEKVLRTAAADQTVKVSVFDGEV